MPPRRRQANNNQETLIKVGVYGQQASEVIVDKTTTAKEVADRLNLGEVRKYKVSKNGTGNFKEIKATDKVNGYKALLLLPAVDGGN